MVEDDYYILIGGNETGPWTLGQVQAFWLAGAVTKETVYAQPGMSEWKQLSTILDDAPTSTTVTDMQPEIGPEAPEANGAMDKPVKPGEMDLAKLRQWLRGKLAAIGFTPATKETAADNDKFDDWLCRFTGSEQEVIFGANNIHRYRKGDLTWQGLIEEFERLQTPTADKPEGSRKQLAPENALWIMEVVCGAEPRIQLDLEKYKRMGRESAEQANKITMERRRLRALGITEKPDV